MFLVQFYPINTAWFVKVPNFDIDPLNLHPTIREFMGLGLGTGLRSRLETFKAGWDLGLYESLGLGRD